jgi:hypothetical protein
MRPNPQPSAAEEDAEINEQIRGIQIKEQETNTEQAEHEAEIAEILLGMRAAEQAEDIGGGELDVLETTNEAGAANALHKSGLQTAAGAKGERVSEEESQRSCALNIGDIDKPILGDENSIAASHASNRSVNIQRSIEGRVSLEAPARYASPSLQSSNKSSSKKGTSRRSTAFPAQRNNLLSWMESLPGRPPSSLSSLVPTPTSIRNASPSPFRPIENFVPCAPDSFGLSKAAPMNSTTKLTNYITSTTSDLMCILNVHLYSKSPLFLVGVMPGEHLCLTS